MAPGVLEFRYSFKFAKGGEKVHEIRLREDTLELADPPPAEGPEWTELGFHRCPNCPLDPARARRCPVALRLVRVIECFKDAASFDEVTVLVAAPDRHYGKRTTLQDLASALVGLTSVSAGCPILDRMRPLVRTHLPFPSADEHSYRLLGMYLYAQYLNHRAGAPADWDLAGLEAYYREVEAVNKALCKRLNAVRVHDGDVGINAVNVMDSSMHLARLAIEAPETSPWANLFERYWGKPRK